LIGRVDWTAVSAVASAFAAIFAAVATGLAWANARAAKKWQEFEGWLRADERLKKISDVLVEMEASLRTTGYGGLHPLQSRLRAVQSVGYWPMPKVKKLCDADTTSFAPGEAEKLIERLNWKWKS
jgi:hypothetical protein